MFLDITRVWRERPLACRVVVANLIGAGGTSEDRKIRSELDRNRCQTFRKATKEEMKGLPIRCDAFRRQRNCALAP